MIFFFVTVQFDFAGSYFHSKYIRSRYFLFLLFYSASFYSIFYSASWFCSACTLCEMLVLWMLLVIEDVDNNVEIMSTIEEVFRKLFWILFAIILVDFCKFVVQKEDCICRHFRI